MTRYEGPATIRQGEQEVDVECVFTVRPPSETSRGTWYGRFTEAQDGLATGDAEIVLPDGASGRIIIDYSPGSSGTFTGAQAPPGADG